VEKRLTCSVTLSRPDPPSLDEMGGGGHCRMRLRADGSQHRRSVDKIVPNLCSRHSNICRCGLTRIRTFSCRTLWALRTRQSARRLRESADGRCAGNDWQMGHIAFDDRFALTAVGRTAKTRAYTPRVSVRWRTQLDFAARRRQRQPSAELLTSSA